MISKIVKVNEKVKEAEEERVKEEERLKYKYTSKSIRRKGAR